MSAGYKDKRFQDLDYSSVEEIITNEKSGVYIKLRCEIEVLERPYQVERKRGLRTRSTARVKDLFGDTIEIVEFGRRIYKKLKEFYRRGTVVEILSKTVHEEKGNRLYAKLKILEIKEGSSVLSRCQASHGELIIVRSLIKKVKKNGWSLLNEIRKAAVEKAGIVLPKQAKGYRNFLNSLTLQSVSCGRIGKSNGKIHTLAIGNPGKGKGIATRYCKLINSIFEESQIQGNTAVGFIGSMTQKSGSWHVNLGRIPKANNGVFLIQDFDKIPGKEAILNSLNSTMEEGQIIFSGAAQVTVEAVTAVHLDLNRQSSLHDRNQYMKDTIADIGLPSNIISRIDTICDLDKEFIDNIRIMNDITDNVVSGETRVKSRLGRFCRQHGVTIERLLPLLTAYISHHYSLIDLRPVRQIIRYKQDRFLRHYENELQHIPDVDKYIRRFPNSVYKYIAAYTRLQLRHEANKKSVDRSFYYLKQKFEFLKSLRPVSSDKATKLRDGEGSGLEHWTRQNFPDEPLKLKPIYRKYESDGSPIGPMSFSTFRSKIKKFAYKKSHNDWRYTNWDSSMINK